MNKPKVNYLRHRWSSKSGYRFRCLRRGCEETKPQTAHPVCRGREPEFHPTRMRKATHGGGIGPFGKKSPRDRILGPSGKTSESRRARKSVHGSPNPRNRSARRKRRDRWQAEMAWATRCGLLEEVSK
jgi:hypothetical protein